MAFWELGRAFITGNIFHDMIGFYFHGLLKSHFANFKSGNWYRYLSSLEFDDAEIIVL